MNSAGESYHEKQILFAPSFITMEIKEIRALSICFALWDTQHFEVLSFTSNPVDDMGQMPSPGLGPTYRESGN
jgi:hypothetical protein